MQALRKERDTLKHNLFKADDHVRAAQKEHEEGSVLLNHLKQQLISANNIRQRTYTSVMNLRKKLNDKDCFVIQRLFFRVVEDTL